MSDTATARAALDAALRDHLGAGVREADLKDALDRDQVAQLIL